MAVALGRWRAGLKRGEAVDTARAGTFATLSTVQAALVVAMVFAPYSSVTSKDTL